MDDMIAAAIVDMGVINVKFSLASFTVSHEYGWFFIRPHPHERERQSINDAEVPLALSVRRFAFVNEM
jgi:hypothetical protein